MASSGEGICGEPLTSHQSTANILSQVARFYERHTYPNYPLLARPHIEDAYLASVRFAAALSLATHPRKERALVGKEHNWPVLVAGCGEMLPYIFRRQEPASTNILAVDLSGHSLKRARVRLGLRRGNIEFRQQDIVESLSVAKKHGQFFSHIDAYGVLHHLANPALALNGFAETLAPQGNIRLMVYNTAARDWIHQFQKIFQLIKIDPFCHHDYRLAVRFINELCSLDCFREKFSHVGKFTLGNQSRFADTFLHVREARLSYGRWLEIFEQAGLMPFALFDRYGELDDLDNPLWQMPERDQLEPRIADRRFENNFEVYLRHRSPPPHGSKLVAPSHIPGYTTTTTLATNSLFRFRPYPHNWSTFQETLVLTRSQLADLWMAHRRHLNAGQWQGRDEALIGRFPSPAIKRLARLGAILPTMVQSRELQAIAMARLCGRLDPPQKALLPTDLAISLRPVIARLLRERNIDCPRSSKVIEQRLLKSVEN